MPLSACCEAQRIHCNVMSRPRVLAEATDCQMSVARAAPTLRETGKCLKTETDLARVEPSRPTIGTASQARILKSENERKNISKV